MPTTVFVLKMFFSAFMTALYTQVHFTLYVFAKANVRTPIELLQVRSGSILFAILSVYEHEQMRSADDKNKSLWGCWLSQ